MLQLGLTVTFGFFSYYYPEINRSCVAATGAQVPIIASQVSTVGVDVTVNFRMAIRAGFYLSVLNFSRVIVNQVGIWLKSPIMYYIAIVMYGVIFMLALIWFVFLQLWRFSWDGRVCSGDFLE